MQLSNDILTKFAKTVDQEPEKTPVLEFNGIVISVDGVNNTCKVKINNVSQGDTIDMEECTCSTVGIDLIEEGNKVRIKIQNSEAKVIENYDNPANVYNKIIDVSALVTSFDGSYQNRSEKIVELSSQEFQELIEQGYQIVGILSQEYEVKGDYRNATPSGPNLTELTPIWNNEWLCLNFAPFYDFTAYSYFSTEHVLKLLLTSTSSYHNYPGFEMNVIFKIALARPGILEQEE